MAKLIYFTPTSLDGYIADETGNPDWSAPDEEARCTRRWRFGRRQRSFLARRRPCWTSRESGKRPTRSSIPHRGETVSTPKTRLEREFHPQAVRELKAQSPLYITVAGPTLAAHAIRTGLVDEYRLLVVPTMLGGGTRVLPSNVSRMVYLRYRAQT